MVCPGDSIADGLCLTYHNLNHHAPIRTSETRCTSGIDELRDKGTT
jgi:hypothetical protein